MQVMCYKYELQIYLPLKTTLCENQHDCLTNVFRAMMEHIVIAFSFGLIYQFISIHDITHNRVILIQQQISNFLYTEVKNALCVINFYFLSAIMSDIINAQISYVYVLHCIVFMI